MSCSRTQCSASGDVQTDNSLISSSTLTLIQCAPLSYTPETKHRFWVLSKEPSPGDGAFEKTHTIYFGWEIRKQIVILSSYLEV